MMGTILACEMMRDELEHAIQKAGGDYRIYWVDSELHNTPHLQRDHLQEILDSMEEDTDMVLMAFGKCGDAVVGLRTGAYQVALPRTDDCISILLGSTKLRSEISEGNRMYFLTRGWLRGSRNIWAEYQYAVKKYGLKMAKEIMSIMFNNYKYMAVLDSKSYDVESILPQTEAMADTFSLQHRIISGSVDYLRDLLTGPWDTDRFVLFPPHSVITSF
jgi:hypothetical protein